MFVTGKNWITNRVSGNRKITLSVAGTTQLYFFPLSEIYDPILAVMSI